MFVCSLLKRITRCMVDTQKSIAIAYACYWRLQPSKYESWGRNITFPLFLIPLFLKKQRKLWIPTCVLAYNLGQSPRNSVLDSEHFPIFLWCLCGSCQEWKYFCCTVRTSRMALEIRHWNVSHSRDDARTPLWRSRWKNDYSSSNNSAEEFFS